MYRFWVKTDNVINMTSGAVLPDVKSIVFYDNKWYICDQGVLTETTTGTHIGIPDVIYSI